MRLYERLGDAGYHTAIISSFGVDFAAFETIALSRLRAAGCRNVILIADSAMVGLAIDGCAPLPQLAGAQYLLVKATAKGGVFHPKIVLQLGRKGGRMIIASANATAAGLAGNLELASLIECGQHDSGEQRIIADGWEFLGRFLDERQQAVVDKLGWARTRTPWLGQVKPAQGPQLLVDGTEAAFLASGAAEGIGAQFLRMVGEAAADRLVVVSPYWDAGLEALRQLQEDLSVAETAVLIDTAQGLFPVAALENGRAVRVVELAGFDEKCFSKTNRRFIHAKLIVATAGAVDHVLVGSANCTLAALGDGSWPGINEEACLYRRLPAGRVLVELGLESLADGGASVDPAKLPPFYMGEALPLSEARDRDPGLFEAIFNQLHWWPASAALAAEIASGSAAIEVIGDGEPTTALMAETARGLGRLPLRFLLPGKLGRPRLARVRHLDGHYSGFAVVACVDHLRSETREAMNSRSEKASQALEDANEEGLWLLEILDDLEAGDTILAESRLPASLLMRQRKENGAALQDARTLDYSEFLAGRRRRLDPAEAERNSLAGSTSSLVRGFLNRLAGMLPGETDNIDGLSDDEQVLSALNTGDEVANGASAVEGGLELGQPVVVPIPPAAHVVLRRLADAQAFRNAVSTYRARIAAAASIGPKEVLRLRALLAAIAIAGFCNATAKPSAVQVLPTVAGGGVETWPRMMGRALETVFGARQPAIHRLQIDAIHDRWPTDILEAWATCVWASEAALDAARAVPALSNLVPILTALSGRVASLTALTAEERSSSEFVIVHQAMARRFRARLGLNGGNKPTSDTTRERSQRSTPAPGKKKRSHPLGEMELAG